MRGGLVIDNEIIFLVTELQYTVACAESYNVDIATHDFKIISAHAVLGLLK